MKTKTIRQTVRFKASPREVYELLMNSKKHQSLSGEKAIISTQVPGKFTAWNGHITVSNTLLARAIPLSQVRITGRNYRLHTDFRTVLCGLRGSRSYKC